ncbi:MAG TPA: Rv3235 family protein [Pseudonocardia sp.]|nr:Rv3235 family protein [Pseudonocardia sp.]
MTVTLPAPPVADAPSRPRLRRVAYEPGPDEGRPAPAPPPRPPERYRPGGAAREFVDAHRTITRILRLALEVLDGRRPVAQLTAHFADAPLRYWRAATGQRTVQAPARCGRLRLCLPRSGAAEVALTCLLDGRYRALAARFERDEGRWRCTAVRLG